MPWCMESDFIPGGRPRDISPKLYDVPSRRGTPYVYAGQKLLPKETKYSTVEKECLASLYFLWIWLEPPTTFDVTKTSCSSHQHFFSFTVRPANSFQLWLNTAEDSDIIDVCSSQVLIVSEDMVHHPLKHHRCIAKAKWHHSN